MALIDELKQARIECDEQYKRIVVDHAFYAERLNDLDTAIAALQQGEVMITVTNDEPDESAAIAALEPAPETPAPVQPDPPSAELRSDPGSEENAGTILDVPEIPDGFTRWEGGECPVPHGTIVDLICRDPSVRVGQTNQVFAHMISWANEGDPAYKIIAYRIISQPADQSEDEPAEHISILTGDPAVEPESGLHGEPVTLGPPNAFLNSIFERGGTWHDGGDNPAPDWLVDIYVPPGSTFFGEVGEMQSYPSNDCAWNGWEVAYVPIKPAEETHTDDLRTAEGETVDAAEIERRAEGWIPKREFDFPDAEAILEVRWIDGYCERLTFTGYTPTTGEPEWSSARYPERGPDFVGQVTHYRSYPKPAPEPSVLTDPEFQAAVERAEATLAAEPAYVGLQDPELDAEFDAMKARRDADKPKPLTDTWHNKFGIFGKREEV